MWDTDSNLASLVRRDRDLWEEELARQQRMGCFEPEQAHAGASRVPPERGLLLVALGVMAGFWSGFLGIGGGLVIVPVLMIAFHYPMKRAVGTSLATIMLVSLGGVLAEVIVKRSNIHWIMALVVTLASLLGSWAGGKLLPRLPDRSLRLAFSAIVLFAAYRMIAAAPGSGGAGPLTLAGESPVGYLLGFGVGGLAGLTSVLFGLGGGLVMVPAFTLLFGDFPFHAARATSLVQVIPTASFSA